MALKTSKLLKRTRPASPWGEGCPIMSSQAWGTEQCEVNIQRKCIGSELAKGAETDSGEVGKPARSQRAREESHIGLTMTPERRKALWVLWIGMQTTFLSLKQGEAAYLWIGGVTWSLSSLLKQLCSVVMGLGGPLHSLCSIPTCHFSALYWGGECFSCSWASFSPQETQRRGSSWPNDRLW